MPRRAPYYESPAMPPKESAQLRRNFQEFEQTPSVSSTGATGIFGPFTTVATAFTTFFATTVSALGNSRILVVGNWNTVVRDGEVRVALVTILPDGTTRAEQTTAVGRMEITVTATVAVTAKSSAVMPTARLWFPETQAGHYTFKLQGRVSVGSNSTSTGNYINGPSMAIFQF